MSSSPGVTLSQAQKRLLREWNSAQVLWLLYVGGALLLTPLAHPSQLRALNLAQGGALLFCCANTLIAYGAYAEAMHLGEVTRVSATVAISPIFTSLASVAAAGWLLPLPEAELPNVWTWLGVAALRTTNHRGSPTHGARRSGTSAISFSGSTRTTVITGI